jgi:hypothetical protein
MSETPSQPSTPGLGKTFYIHVIAEIVVIAAVVAFFTRKNSEMEKRIKSLEDTVARLANHLQQVTALFSSYQRPPEIRSHIPPGRCVRGEPLAPEGQRPPGSGASATPSCGEPKAPETRGGVQSMDAPMNDRCEIKSSQNVEGRGGHEPTEGPACEMNLISNPVANVRANTAVGRESALGSRALKDARRGAIDSFGGVEMFMIPPLSMMASVINDAHAQLNSINFASCEALTALHTRRPKDVGGVRREPRIEIIPDASLTQGSNPLGCREAKLPSNESKTVDVPFDDTIEDSDSEIAEELEELKLSSEIKAI